ncbi:hypothetical protein JHK84_051993 [Glycine max]|nr:hypothetical protein JHK84_051993 [Glycine max]
MNLSLQSQNCLPQIDCGPACVYTFLMVLTDGFDSIGRTSSWCSECYHWLWCYCWCIAV